MKFDHIAVCEPSESESDKFFINLLDLKKEYEFLVPENLSDMIFGIKKDFRVIRYGKEDFNVEVFITTDKISITDHIKHIGITVENKDVILKKAQSLGFPINKIKNEKGNSYYLFIRDSFGNYFEIKE